MTSRPIIRPAIPSDMPALDAIYDHYIATTAITFDIEPWPPGRRSAWLAERAENRDLVLAAELDGRPTGFGWTSPFRTKPAYRTTAELSVYLAPDARGLGLGTSLIAELLAALPSLGKHVAVAGVALPNPASRALFLRHGFTSTGVLHEVGFKLGRFWDVEWFERILAPCPTGRRPMDSTSG
jgi:phosphinothricin acetyltransferase